MGKRRLLIACDVAGIAAHGGHSPLRDGGVFSIELLYGIGFLLGSAEVLWGVTTDFSVLPSLVEEHELTDANAIFLAADRAARIVGPTLGSFAIAAIGNVSAMWIAAWPPARADTRVRPF